MQTRQSSTSASLALALMIVSLVVIYLVVPQTDIVTTISVLILVLTLIMGLVGDPSDVRVMTGLAALVSLVAAGFLGERWLSTAGAILVPALWLLFLVWTFRQLRAATLVIPEDHAVMYAPFLNSQVYQVDPGQAVPFTMLDRHVATIPLYELTLDAQIKKVNTRQTPDIDLVVAHIRYRVSDPARALVGIPNRGKIQNDVARELGMSVERARREIAFWEKLLAKQMEEEVDDILREIAFRERDERRGNIYEAYLDRKTLSGEVMSGLRMLVSRWGVTVTHLDLDFYEVDKEAIKGIKSGGPDEVLKKELVREKMRRTEDTENDANYLEKIGKKEADLEAERVRALIAALQDQLDRPLSTRELEEIVISAIRASGETPITSMSYPGLFEENRSEKSSGGSGSNGAKK